jgi:hypothetical protein
LLRKVIDVQPASIPHETSQRRPATSGPSAQGETPKVSGFSAADGWQGSEEHVGDLELAVRRPGRDRTVMIRLETFMIVLL